MDDRLILKMEHFSQIFADYNICNSLLPIRLLLATITTSINDYVITYSVTIRRRQQGGKRIMRIPSRAKNNNISFDTFACSIASEIVVTFSMKF